MEYLPVLELIDRLCIARVKHRRTNGANSVERDWYERQYEQLQRLVSSVEELEHNVAAMTAIHEAI
jgi:predicted ABC-type ATPase